MNDRRKPPYQQGYEDGKDDRKNGGAVTHDIIDYDCYNNDPDSKDSIFYYEGYEEGFLGKPIKDLVWVDV